MVHEYCENLGSRSVYSAVLQTCIKVMTWYGYVQDTIASFVYDRSCTLRENMTQFGNSNPIFNCFVAYNHPDMSCPAEIDAYQPVKTICQSANQLVLVLLKSCLELRGTMSANGSVNQEVQKSALSKATATVRSFEDTYGKWLRGRAQVYGGTDVASEVSISE
jgi:hypothetical protein